MKVYDLVYCSAIICITIVNLAFLRWIMRADKKK